MSGRGRTPAAGPTGRGPATPSRTDEDAIAEDLAAMTGGCRCGATRYALTPGLRPHVYACHCLDCQTWSGSAFSEQALLPTDAITLTGPTTRYTHDTPRGFVANHTLCAVCHTRICNTNSAKPGTMVLRAGTLDASDRLEPTAHVWTKRKQPWVALPAGTPAWDEAPTPEAFANALRDA